MPSVVAAAFCMGTAWRGSGVPCLASHLPLQSLANLRRLSLHVEHSRLAADLTAATAVTALALSIGGSGWINSTTNVGGLRPCRSWCFTRGT